jgi:hypothetical protein
MSFDVNLKVSTGFNVTLSGIQGVIAGGLLLWNGTAWVEKPVKVWNNVTWLQKPVKTWNGTTWFAMGSPNPLPPTGLPIITVTMGTD